MLDEQANIAKSQIPTDKLGKIALVAEQDSSVCGAAFAGRCNVVRALKIVVATGLMLVSTNSFATQKIVFTAETYKAISTTYVHLPVDVSDTCLIACDQYDKKISQYIESGWRIISVIPNQTIELESSEPAFRALVKCTCTGNKYVIEKND